MADDYKKTPTTFDIPPDATTQKGAGVYPNFDIKKTRSGHTLIFDDSEGAESITIKHRGGSYIQWDPKGQVIIGAGSGMYTFVLGENRIVVTGSHDLVVKGDCSMRVDGDYNTTVAGNMNLAVEGDMIVQAKSLNQMIKENIDTSAKNMATKIEGSTEITTHGLTTIASDAGMTLASTGGNIGVKAGGDIGIKATGLGFMQTGGTFNIKGGGAMKVQSSGKMSMKGGSIAMEGSTIDLNSGNADSADDASITHKKG
jgi:hypothetical protein